MKESNVAVRLSLYALQPTCDFSRVEVRCVRKLCMFFSVFDAGAAVGVGRFWQVVGRYIRESVHAGGWLSAAF